MKSYASVDRVEGKIVVFELEMLDLEDSKTEDFSSKETVMVDVPLECIKLSVSDVTEGDIIVVEHYKGDITDICYKDDAEKNRRIEQIKAINER